jgi:acyl-CoA hydrolase
MKRNRGSPDRFDDPDRVADAIINRVGKNLMLALPLGLGKANHVANALFARASSDPSIRLHIFTALTLEAPHGAPGLERRFVQPFAERVFAGYPELAYGAAQRAGTLAPNITVDEFFFQAGTRLGVAAAQQNYISANYAHALRYVLARGVNVVAQLVAKRERGGETRLSLSCNPDLTLDLLASRAREQCGFLFVGQVNSELPFMPGDGDVAEQEFDLLLEGPATDFPLFAPPRESIDLAEHATGIHVARTIADGGTLQLGIGSLGDAVAHALILRHRASSDFRGIAARLDPAERAPIGMRESDPFAAGLHGLSEMLVESFLDLMHAGILKREVDGALLHAAFFLGSRAFYRALRDMPEAELAKLRMTSVLFVNQLYGDEAAKRRARVKARFINNAMMVTLLGAVVSDALDNGQVVSGVGGQYNFVAQAFALEDARSIIMVRATRDAHRRTASNIRWNYGHTTIPRHLRRRGDGIRRRGFAREDRPGRDRGHARGRRFPLPGRIAATGEGGRQDRARLRAAGGLPRQHSRAHRARSQAGARAGAAAAVSVRHRFHHHGTASSPGAGAVAVALASTTRRSAGARISVIRGRA